MDNAEQKPPELTAAQQAVEGERALARRRREEYRIAAALRPPPPLPEPPAEMHG